MTAVEVLEVQEKRGQEQTERECLADHGTRENSQTQFERFLLSLPRVDSVDRTVDWVLAQPDHIEVIQNNYCIINTIENQYYTCDV